MTWEGFRWCPTVPVAARSAVVKKLCALAEERMSQGMPGHARGENLDGKLSRTATQKQSPQRCRSWWMRCGRMAELRGWPWTVCRCFGRAR